MIQIITTSDDKNRRVDEYIVEKLKELNLEWKFSRSQVHKMIENGKITLNKQNLGIKSLKLKENDEIEINLEDSIRLFKNIQPLEYKPNSNVKIVYEDDYLLVISKPAGTLSHPGGGDYENTLVNAMLNKSLSANRGQYELGIVHRLDKNTSGLMIMAKDGNTHNHLAEQIATKTCQRKYLALCYGIVKPLEGSIKTFVAPHLKAYNKMSISSENNPKSQIAITDYQTVEVINKYFSIVECSLQTGRTHQVRLHLQHLKHPIVGDEMYSYPINQIFLNSLKKEIKENDAENLLKIQQFFRQALHSYYIKFTHPVTKQEMEFKEEIADDIKELIATIRSLNLE